MTGADELRRLVSNIDIQREGFNQRFTAEQLLQLERMLQKSEWDIYPDSWTERQIREALAGHPPRFADDGAPIYAPRKRGKR